MYVCAWITFSHQEARDRAIEFTNNSYFDDGRILKATNGFNRYCKHFMKNKKCPKKNCEDYHYWTEDLSHDGIITDFAWNNYVAKPCGIIRADGHRRSNSPSLNAEPRYFVCI